jgi:hypothetical protein
VPDAGFGIVLHVPMYLIPTSKIIRAEVKPLSEATALGSLS